MKVLEVHKNKILVSKDYKLFNYNNKKILPSRLEKLIDEMSVKNLSKDLPIIIDEQFNILDGKYRFVANQKLKQPIYYKVAEKGNFIDFMKAANLQYKPKLKDYAIVHSDKASYRKCLEYYNKLPMTFDAFIYDFFGIHARGRNDYNKFREGLFELDLKDEFKIKQALKIYEYILENLGKNVEHGSFSNILVNCNYLFSDFKSKCEKNKITLDKYLFIVNEGYPLESFCKDYKIDSLIDEFDYADRQGDDLEEVYNKTKETEYTTWKGIPIMPESYEVYPLSKLINEIYNKLI